MRLWERIHKDLQDSGEYSQDSHWERIHEDLQGFAGFDETLGEYSQGFMRIRKDSQDS